MNHFSAQAVWLCRGEQLMRQHFRLRSGQCSFPAGPITTSMTSSSHCQLDGDKHFAVCRAKCWSEGNFSIQWAIRKCVHRWKIVSDKEEKWLYSSIQCIENWTLQQRNTFKSMLDAEYLFYSKIHCYLLSTKKDSASLNDVKENDVFRPQGLTSPNTRFRWKTPSKLKKSPSFLHRDSHLQAWSWGTVSAR